MNTLFADCLIHLNPEIYGVEVADHLVMLNIAKGEYYDLDPVAADIWKRLAVAQTAAALRDQLVDAYEGAEEQIDADLQGFLADMLARGMIRVEAL